MDAWALVTGGHCPKCGKKIDTSREYESDGRGSRRRHAGEAAEMVLFMENADEIHIDVVHETMADAGELPEYIGPRGKPSALYLALAVAEDRMCPLVFPKTLSLRGFVAHTELTRKETA